jgi:hypothetical protein
VAILPGPFGNREEVHRWQRDHVARSHGPHCAGETGKRQDEQLRREARFVAQEQRQRKRDDRDADREAVTQAGARESDRGDCDDRDDRGTDRAQDRLHLRHLAVCHVDERQRQDDQHSRHDETQAGDDQAGHAGADEAEMDSQLGRVRTRDEIERRDQVDEVAAIDPLTANDDFVLHQRDVRCGPPNAVNPSRVKSLATSSKREGGLAMSLTGRASSA